MAVEFRPSTDARPSDFDEPWGPPKKLVPQEDMHEQSADPLETSRDAKAIESALLETAHERQSELEHYFSEAARDIFGERVDAKIWVREGSVVIDVLVAGVLGLQTVKSVIELVEWYRERARSILERSFGHRIPRESEFELVIADSASPAFGLLQPSDVGLRRAPSRLGLADPLSIYLVVSHAVLLAVVVVALVRSGS
jgi:hypothetical protein